jgi:hypothetical protein
MQLDRAQRRTEQPVIVFRVRKYLGEQRVLLGRRSRRRIFNPACSDESRVRWRSNGTEANRYDGHEHSDELPYGNLLHAIIVLLLYHAVLVLVTVPTPAGQEAAQTYGRS